MISPLLYDVRRSLARPSTVATLLVFAFFGAAISYWMFTMAAAAYKPLDGVAVVARGRSGCVALGVVANRRGEPTGATLTLLSGTQRLYSFSVAGVFAVNLGDLCERELPSEIEVSTPLLRFNLTTRAARVPSPVGVYDVASGGITIVGVFSYGGVDGYMKLDPVILYFKSFVGDPRTGSARLYVLALNTSSEGLRPTSPLQIRYAALPLSPGQTIEESRPPKRVDGALVVDDYVGSYTIEPKPDGEMYYLALYAELGETKASLSVNHWLKVALERSYVDYLMGSAGIDLFTTFFPVVLLYLVYVLVAKPRSSGALEFVLARPVTRFDLYVSRYAAGALTTAISSAVFVSVLVVLFPILLGVSLDARSYALLYLGVTASLVTFYTLCYAVASWVRSGVYLAVSLALFLTLSVLWNVVTVLIALASGVTPLSRHFEELTYSMAYLNPLRFQSFARYLITLAYGAAREVSAVNPALCVIVPVLWNVLLFALGYYSFRRANLSG